MKENHFINSHKAVTFLYFLLLMIYFDRWENITLWVYLALHGTYGLLLAFKSMVFPDKQWEQSASILRGIIIWAGLTLYWIAPFIIAMNDVHAPYWLLALAISANIIGAMFHFASDMQKYIQRQLKPGHLITDGFWRLSRSPNYFGEFLIYGSFTILALHWLPFVAFAVMIFAAWMPYMRQKEKSLSRYPEFTDYKARTRSFFPYLF